MNQALRTQLVRLHTWSGLSIGLVMVFLALTGAGFVLRPALERGVDHSLLVIQSCQPGQRLTLDRLADIARTAHPQGKLDQFLIFADPTRSLAVQFLDKDMVYLNPCDGAVLGIRNEYGGFMGVMDWLHRFKFLGEEGKLVAGWSTAVYILLLLIVGVWLWWPKNRKLFGRALTFQRRLPGIARTLSLHKIVGVYSSVILLAVATMGLPIAFKPVNDLLYDITGSKKFGPPPKSLPIEGATPLPAENFWRQAQTVMPDQSWTLLRLPRKPDDAVYLELLEGDAPHDLAKSYLFFDAYSGEIKLIRHYRTDTPQGRKLYLWMIELHSAAWGGLAYQTLLFLCALGMAVQFYSGASPWLRRKLRRPAVTRLLLRVTRKEIEATDICVFELTDPKGRLLPPFSAGSHIDVILPDGKIRQYSLCNDPEDRHRYQIGVLRMAGGRGGSVQMHDGVQEGDLIEIGAPRNHFPLAHGARHSLLLAGGIGITPILCMAERLSNIGADFALHHTVRSADRAAFWRRISQSAFAERARVHCDDGPPDQRFDIAATLAAQPDDTHLYVCGPGGFMDAVLREAQRQAWPESRLHREYFAGTANHAADDRAFAVKLASSGQTITIDKDRSVVEALAEHGIEIQTSCGTGVCGTCLTRVLEGEPDHRDLFQTAEERARNDQFTPCCSRARSDMLVLDL